VALRQVFTAAAAVKIPVIGLGGIATAEDALEFILVGAAAVQVGTAALADPRTPINILNGIRDWMLKEKLDDLSQLRGTLKP
jgi:dihydroorotate dehydrogenase (NAD+) catalytic subunit